MNLTFKGSLILVKKTVALRECNSLFDFQDKYKNYNYLKTQI